MGRKRRVIICPLILAILIYILLVPDPNIFHPNSSKPNCKIMAQVTPDGRGGEFAQTDFQIISNGTNNKMYMYSAYFDSLSNIIKVIGGAKLPALWDNIQTVYCQYYNSQKRLVSITKGTVVPVELSQTLPYGAAFILCPLGDTAQQDCSAYPSYVSISTRKPDLDPAGQPSNMFYIQYPPSPSASPLPIEFSLCVQPTFDYDNPQRFVEWIEYYLLMGVGSFTFYNVSIGPTTSCLMRLYQKRWTQLEVLPWTLGFVPFVEFFMYGQLVQINDCMYRGRGHSKYVVNVDFDEFIVPNYNSGSNFNELIQIITESVPKSMEKGRSVGPYSAYVFQNGFFFLNEVLDKDYSTESTNLVIESKTLRARALHPAFERSKYIANPQLVDHIGVHYVYKSVGPSEMLVVPPDIAYLHHYRATDQDQDQGGGGRKRPQTVTRKIISLSDKDHIIDKSGTRFAPALRNHILKKLYIFRQECGFIFEL